MNLFNSEKDLIWRVVNAVLLIWVLISVVLLINFGIIDTLLKEPREDYTTYKRNSCTQVKMETEEEVSTPDCKGMFKYNEDQRDYYKMRNILGSAASLLVSGATLVYFNRPTTKSKKKK